MHHTTKVVINAGYGGFELSDLAYAEMIKRGIKVLSENEYLELEDDSSFPCLRIISNGIQRYHSSYFRCNRSDPLLIEIVELLGEKASSPYSKLKIVELPSDVKQWYIDDSDGWELIREEHRTWE